jgi:hypothetical protein
MIITNTSGQVAHCDVGAHDFIGVDLWEGWGPKIRAVSASAELFRPTEPQMDDWCVEQVPVTPPLLFTDYPCGLADHLWFGDVSGVHGSVFCPIG